MGLAARYAADYTAVKAHLSAHKAECLRKALADCFMLDQFFDFCLFVGFVVVITYFYQLIVQQHDLFIVTAALFCFSRHFFCGNIELFCHKRQLTLIKVIYAVTFKSGGLIIS